MQKLYLEGADWDVENSCLCEPVPLKFISELPVVHFQPVVTVGKHKGEKRARVYTTYGRIDYRTRLRFFRHLPVSGVLLPS